MTIRRTRTIREGDARRAAQRAADIAGKLADEQVRHRLALQKFAARRSVAALRPDPEARGAALAVVAAQVAEEERRHRTKVDALKQKNNRR